MYNKCFMKENIEKYIQEQDFSTDSLLKIIEKNYVDSDYNNKELYEQHKKYLEKTNEKIEIVKTTSNYPPKTDKYNGKHALSLKNCFDEEKVIREEWDILSSDCFGPSRTSILKKLKNKKDDDQEKIKLYYFWIYIGHLYGAFILWPGKQLKRKQTINQARNIPYDDRIDLILFHIKEMYDKNFDENANYSMNLNKNITDTLLRYTSFFEKISYLQNKKKSKKLEFKDFIDFFDLNIFCDNNYEVYDLTTDTNFKSTKFLEYFENYINNSNPEPLDIKSSLKYVNHNSFKKLNSEEDREIYNNNLCCLIIKRNDSIYKFLKP